jgi:hypothetical protein
MLLLPLVVDVPYPTGRQSTQAARGSCGSPQRGIVGTGDELVFVGRVEITAIDLCRVTATWAQRCFLVVQQEAILTLCSSYPASKHLLC